MKVWMLWHGGHSYAVGDLSNIEEFDSIGQAVRVFDGRRDNFDGSTPCVDESAEAWLFLSDPREGDLRDPYPDRVIEVGPRGGIRVTPA